MINEIVLANFQAHEETVLELHPGINVIIGKTNNGKTSIIRGIKLAAYNKPAGDAFVSNWARNEKGNQTDQMDVVIIKPEGELCRGKGPELNGYEVNSKKFTALGKGGLPQEVTDFFNFTEVNLQEQMDGPFLLGATSSEKAKFLNKIVDMTEIDLFLSSIVSKKRGNTADVRRMKKEVEDFKIQLQSFEILEEAEEVNKALKKIDAEKTSKKQAISTLSIQIDNFNLYNKKVLKYRGLDKIEALLIDLSGKKELIYTKEQTVIELKRDIRRVKANKKILDEAASYKKLTKLAEDLLKIHEARGDLVQDQEKLQKEIRLVKTLSTSIEKYSSQISSLKVEIPDTCPTCGQAWPKGAKKCKK